MRAEIWRMIPRYPCKYEVSDRGRVRSLWLINAKIKRLREEPLIMKQRAINGGYGFYLLRNWDKRVKGETVSRLILEAFVGPAPSPNHEAAHEDGVPSHNYLRNLTWKTAKANHADMRRHGTAPIGERSKNAILTSGQVLEIRRLYVKGSYGYSRLATEYGVARTTVIKIIHRENWAHLP